MPVINRNMPVINRKNVAFLTQNEGSRQLYSADFATFVGLFERSIRVSTGPTKLCCILCAAKLDTSGFTEASAIETSLSIVRIVLSLSAALSNAIFATKKQPVGLFSPVRPEAARRSATLCLHTQGNTTRKTKGRSTPTQASVSLPGRRTGLGNGIAM